MSANHLDPGANRTHDLRFRNRTPAAQTGDSTGPRGGTEGHSGAPSPQQAHNGHAIKGNLLALGSADLAERFAAKFTPEPNTGCWLWTAALNNCGYAVLSLGIRTGNTRVVAYAHRVAWELEHGPVPDGLTLDHRCCVRHCVNPAHLEPVSHKVNCQRRSQREAA